MCQDWANTKAAYRFLDNERVSETEILAGHFQATRDRTAATVGPLLVLHDTTEFSFQRDDIDAVGITRKAVAGAYRNGTLRHYTACGILMHSSLAVTTEGLPLGLTAVKFWTREKFKGTNALKKKINPTRVPIEEKESVRWLENLRQSTELVVEPTRCVHIGDRESDIYELFCTAQDAGTHFLLRTCVDRGAAAGIDYEKEDLREALRALTGGRGVDVVYDPVGGKYAEPAFRGTAWRGRYLVIGFASGEIPKFPLNQALLMERRILGVYWGESTRRDPEASRAGVLELSDWLASGKLKPYVSATYPLERAAQALQDLMARKVQGKVMLLTS